MKSFYLSLKPIILHCDVTHITEFTQDKTKQAQDQKSWGEEKGYF